MLLGNVLHNHGCIEAVATKDSKKDIDDFVKEEVARGMASGQSASDPNLPFGDSPDLIPKTPRNKTLTSSSDASVYSIDELPSSSSSSSSSNKDNSMNQYELLSNQKVSNLSFHFTFHEGFEVSETSGGSGGSVMIPIGTPQCMTPTKEALEKMKKSSSSSRSKGSKGGAKGGGSMNRNNNQVNDDDIESITLLLAAEEMALANDRKALGQDVLSLKECEVTCRTNQKLLTEEKAEMQQERNDLLIHQFLNEARQVKLLSELQNIYPIHLVDKTKDSHDVWAIRSLELPKDLTSLDDEHISSALGYVVHLLAMISKYLQIPLRYQLIYAASRSSIRDRVGITPSSGNYPSGSGGLASPGGSLDHGSGSGGGGVSDGSGGVFPLYRRGVEPGKFERATNMLAADIEQVLWCRSVRSEAVMRMFTPLDDDGMGATGLSAAQSGNFGTLGTANGSDMLQNLEKLLRYEISPQLV